MSKLTLREKQAIATMVRAGKKESVRALLKVLKEDSRYCPRCGRLLSLDDFVRCYCRECNPMIGRKWRSQFPNVRARSIRKK